MPTENWRRKEDWNKRPLPPIGAAAFVVFVLCAVMALVTWNWTWLAIGVGGFLCLAAIDAYMVGRGK